MCFDNDQYVKNDQYVFRSYIVWFILRFQHFFCLYYFIQRRNEVLENLQQNASKAVQASENRVRLNSLRNFFYCLKSKKIRQAVKKHKQHHQKSPHFPFWLLSFVIVILFDIMVNFNKVDLKKLPMHKMCENVLFDIFKFSSNFWIY